MQKFYSRFQKVHSSVKTAPRWPAKHRTHRWIRLQFVFVYLYIRRRVPRTRARPSVTVPAWAARMYCPSKVGRIIVLYLAYSAWTLTAALVPRRALTFRP